MSNKKKLNLNGVFTLAAVVLSLIAILLSGVALFNDYFKKGEVQYVMYLGTNDKDTNKPVMAPDKSKAAAEEILLKHFGGYTIQEANGGWVDGETVYSEYTLVIYLSDTTLDKVHAAGDELIAKFNQSSVLIQANKTTTEFYEGKK